MYFDAAYIAKCYLNEPQAERVRSLAYKADALCSCELARIEFSSVVHRHLRERRLTPQDANRVFQRFEEHADGNLWQWLPITADLIKETYQSMKRLPKAVILRTIDAIHLTCAKTNGFGEIYTNDRNLLVAAGYFDLKAQNVLD